LVLTRDKYDDPAYWGDTVESQGLVNKYGYPEYAQRGQKNRFDEGKENEPYNPDLREFANKLDAISLINKKVLDIGGAIGLLAEYAKAKGISVYDILDWSDWVRRHVLPGVDNFIFADAKTELANMAAKSYDIILSMQFLDCIDKADLPNLITQMNRVAKTRQVHIVTTQIDPLYADGYTIQDLNWWSQQGFKKGTILVSHHSKEVLVV